MTTLADRWKAEGEARGEARGRVEGRRGVLVQLLALKFGTLSEGTHERIAAAAEADLLRWTERVLTADSVDAVLGD